MIVKKIDAVHPNGTQTVPNDLTAVTVKAAGACDYHCANKCHSAHKKCFGHYRRNMNKTRSCHHQLTYAAFA
jgi:hypothetical protein